MTATPRVQHILDVATKHGWEVEDRDNNTWSVHPPNTDALHPDGFTVYNSGAKGARVVSQNDWKPVSQKNALNSIASHPQPLPDDLSLDGLLKGIIDNPNVLVVEGAVDLSGIIEKIRQRADALIEALPESEREHIGEFAGGAMLASSTLAELVDRCAADGERALAEAKAQFPDEEAVITSRSGAQAWLSLASLTHDPYIIRRVFKDREVQPTEAEFRGAASMFSSCKKTWEMLADSIYLLDTAGEEAVPVSQFFADMHKHAQSLREHADQTYGQYVTVSDAELEGLLS